MITALVLFGYGLMILTVACVGTFGISANMPELRARCKKAMENSWGKQSSYFYTYYPKAVRWAVIKLIMLTLLMALVWPLAIPLYFAWKKGHFIAQALEERERRDQEAREEAKRERQRQAVAEKEARQKALREAQIRSDALWATKQRNWEMEGYRV